jgi:hypothetical protein
MLLISVNRVKLGQTDAKACQTGHERLNESELGGNTWKHNLELGSSPVTTSLDEALLK